MSVSAYHIFHLFNNCLLSSFWFAIVGTSFFCLLWYVAVSTIIRESGDMFGSRFCINHSMHCLVFILSW